MLQPRHAVIQFPPKTPNGQEVAVAEAGPSRYIPHLKQQC
jgi:hypothetical protein